MDHSVVMDINNKPRKDGRWTDEEHRKFLQGITTSYCIGLR
jgi:hypothetical protein